MPNKISLFLWNYTFNTHGLLAVSKYLIHDVAKLFFLFWKGIFYLSLSSQIYYWNECCSSQGAVSGNKVIKLQVVERVGLVILTVILGNMFICKKKKKSKINFVVIMCIGSEKNKQTTKIKRKYKVIIQHF